MRKYKWVVGQEVTKVFKRGDLCPYEGGRNICKADHVAGCYDICGDYDVGDYDNSTKCRFKRKEEVTYREIEKELIRMRVIRD